MRLLHVPFLCLLIAGSMSHEDERIVLVEERRFAGGCSGRFRGRGCRP